MRVRTLPAPPPPIATKRSYAGVLKLVVPLLFVLGAVGFWYFELKAPEPGSREDLTARLDAVDVDSMLQTDEFFTSGADCRGMPTCPGLTRYYSIPGSVQGARDEVAAGLSERGLEVTPNGVDPNLIVAKGEGYIYFLVFHPPDAPNLPMHDALPPSVEADLTVALNTLDN